MVGKIDQRKIMLRFRDFVLETVSQAAISKSAKQDNVSFPGSSKAEIGYAKKMGKTILSAVKKQQKTVPEVVF